LAETDSGYHNDLIIDQFTKQAIPFTQNAAHSAEYAIKRLVTLSNVSKKDHVTGIDITPAMIEQANLLRQQKNLCNIKCEIGDVTHLPYGDESFSIMITRYSFHHRVDPYSVLSEMKRVSTKGKSCGN